MKLNVLAVTGWYKREGIVEEKLREEIKPGYRAFNGYVFNEYNCKAYNAVQSRINSFISAKMPVPEELLNGSHNLFISIIGVRNA